jgi:hypothetical protein
MTPPSAASEHRHPTVDEMRVVAYYLADVMGLHSCAGKLLARADKLSRR